MKYFFLLLFAFSFFSSEAQYRRKNQLLKNLELPPSPTKNAMEVGGFLQLGSYQGDLNPSNFTFISTDPGIGFFIKRNPVTLLPNNTFRRSRIVRRVFNAEIFGAYQKLSFKDANINDLRGINPFCYSSNLRRNLGFSTNILQLGMDLEYNPFIIGYQNYFAPYAVAGFSGIYFNPKTTYTLDGVTKTVNLRKLQTEGINYFNISSVVNLGIGFRFVSEQGYTIGIELFQNFTQTDYLDDVSRFYPADFSSLTPEQILLSARGIELDKDFIASGYSSAWLKNNPEIVKKYAGKRRGDSYDKDAFWNLKISYSQILKLRR
ncbi:MAG: hypothetical protein ACOVOL_06015 [Bacteroidia bacterium]|jgi:hypothetical protein